MQHRRVLRGLAFALILVSCAVGSVGAWAADAPIDVNKADVEQLQALPGIGPATAKRIVDFRTKHGPFKTVDDLLKVKGIGDRSLERLRPYVTVKPRRGR